jgi:carbon storage regulator
MLVLSRKRDERILIGDNVVITVVDVRGDKVRLGIDAPKEVPVHREEVALRLQEGPVCKNGVNPWPPTQPRPTAKPGGQGERPTSNG